MGKMKDLAGERFGRLLAIETVGRTKNRHLLWRCKCDCGNETVVLATNLIAGKTASCGCLEEESRANRCTKHNLYHTIAYRAWAGMIQRCTNKNLRCYKHYGGRGITVCAEWKADFQSFYAHVSALPHFNEKGRSLDRINNDGNYEPGNVRWATKSEQNKNRRYLGRKRHEEESALLQFATCGVECWQ